MIAVLAIALHVSPLELVRLAELEPELLATVADELGKR